MPRKKKAAGGANESRWVRTPTQGSLCDVAYEHRCHTEPVEVAGITFEPGQIVTYHTREDVPDALLEHPDLIVRDVPFGVCRIDPMFRYTPLTLFMFETLKAGVTEPVVEEVVENPTTSEPEPLPDDAEPEGGE